MLEKGAEYIHWDEKRKEYAHQTGSVRRGVGVSLFSYKTGVWPISLEIAGARLSMNQDGSVQFSWELHRSARVQIRYFLDGSRDTSHGCGECSHCHSTGYT